MLTIVFKCHFDLIFKIWYLNKNNVVQFLKLRNGAGGPIFMTFYKIHYRIFCVNKPKISVK